MTRATQAFQRLPYSNRISLGRHNLVLQDGFTTLAFQEVGVEFLQNGTLAVFKAVRAGVVMWFVVGHAKLDLQNVVAGGRSEKFVPRTFLTQLIGHARFLLKPCEAIDHIKLLKAQCHQLIQQIVCRCAGGSRVNLVALEKVTNGLGGAGSVFHHGGAAARHGDKAANLFRINHSEKFSHKLQVASCPML